MVVQSAACWGRQWAEPTVVRLVEWTAEGLAGQKAVRLAEQRVDPMAGLSVANSAGAKVGLLAAHWAAATVA